MSDQKIANLSSITLLLPTSQTATANGTGVDVTALEGNFAVIVESAVGTGTTPTFDLKLQDSATVGGTYADVAGAAITQIAAAAAGPLNRQIIVVDKNKVKSFIRAAITISGTTPVFLSSAVIVGAKKYT